MAYDSRNPKKNSLILVDEAGTPANPPAGSTKIITRSGVLYHRNSAGTESAVLTGSSAYLASGKSADYTVTDTDNVRTVLMTTSSTDRTVTLPTAADNTNRIITVKKVDSGTGKTIIDGEGSETVDGATSMTLFSQYDSVTLQCNGTSWFVLDQSRPPSSSVRSDTGNGHGSGSTKIRKITNHTTIGNAITAATDNTLGTTYTINEAGVYTISYTEKHTGAAFDFAISINSANLTTIPSSLSAAERLVMAVGQSGAFTNCSATVRLAAGDVVRPHTDGTPTNTSNAVQFVIAQVAKL